MVPLVYMSKTTSFIPETTFYTMYILPNTTETRSFADDMQKYWLDVSWPLPGNGPFLPLGFIFLDTQEELESIYADKNLSIPVQLAVVFDGNPYTNL